jgi:hypothetical protein
MLLFQRGGLRRRDDDEDSNENTGTTRRFQWNFNDRRPGKLRHNRFN